MIGEYWIHHIAAVFVKMIPLAEAPLKLQFSPDVVKPMLYVVKPMLYVVKPMLYVVKPMLYIVKPMLYVVKPMLYIVNVCFIA